MESNPILINPTDLLRVKYCSLGTRLWFRKMGLDWDRFLREGLLSDEVEATGDAMAIDLVKKIRAIREGVE